MSVVAALPVERCHVTELSPFTAYTFAVRAGSTSSDDVIVAWSDWSDATSVVTEMARKCLVH